MSSTKFLYEAALRSPEVVSPTGKRIEIHDLAEGGESGECRICALATERGSPWSKTAKKTFTDHDVCRRPASPVVCEYCVWAMGWAKGASNSPGGLSTFRFYSIFAIPSGVEIPSRARWREILTEEPASPYLACLAVSGKKWLHIKARVGCPAPYWEVMLEERRVILAPIVLSRVLVDFEALYAGFPKDQVTGEKDYSPPLINHFGVERFDRHERRLKIFRGTDLFQVAAFIAQKPEEQKEDQREEEEKPCATGSSPKEKRSESRLF